MITTDISRYFRFDELERQLGEAPEGRAKLFTQPAFKTELETRLDAMLDGEKILSLDVFDTLILRDNSSEITRFYEIAGIMAAIVSAQVGREVSQVDAFVARYLGTKATYRASRTVRGCREGSLREMHATASRLLTGTSAHMEDFIESEIGYEANRIEVNSFLSSYMQAYRSAGGKVVLVTDMYMHAEHVSKLLALLGLPSESYDFLVSSADSKVSKASGLIFPLVEAEMQADPDRFVHLGDSFRGDVAQPIRRGWQALHLPLSNFDQLARARDHLKTQHMLAAEHKISLDIANPR